MRRPVPHVLVRVDGRRAVFVSEHPSKSDASEERRRLGKLHARSHNQQGYPQQELRVVKAEVWHGGEFWTQEGGSPRNRPAHAIGLLTG